ncbi:Gfo/Idh/MocA family oxidoreductase [Loktanella sp. F6476L]|uniref:Gfo/Idh/MocA family protein n=1 Tax=Loktanella sp. F6476L TaxID=2926405 RepID=UPI001FF2E1EE|nr:Gfo/Idh/MocA family oxidoreductase [Loktanella sp. F6476L]MCK0120691.1 Gfo/Idh/MocA family oxidoreductase [Loktanella sp. F6476L]
MSQHQPIGIALIGAGMIAERHVKAISAAQDDMHLRAVVSRNPDRARGLAEAYDGPAPIFTSDLSEIARDPDIHMAIVATPPSVRADVIAPLANAGKHILLEKPVGRTTAEATEVVEICEEAGVTLGVLFQHRVRDTARAAAKYVADGTLGRLGHVEIAVPIWRAQSYYDELGRGTYARDGGGVLLTNAIHSIDLALSLTGPVKSVQAMTATSPLHRMEAEDVAVVGLQFASGAVGSLLASTATFPHGTETIMLHFSQASLRMTKDTLTVSWHDGRVETPFKDNSDGVVVPLSGGQVAWHQDVIADFATAIRTGSAPLVTGRQALESHALITAIETSSRLGQRVDMGA